MAGLLPWPAAIWLLLLLPKGLELAHLYAKRMLLERGTKQSAKPVLRRKSWNG
jgi:hypothetical protein